MPSHPPLSGGEGKQIERGEECPLLNGGGTGRG